jgi:hypothetical protein
MILRPWRDGSVHAEIPYAAFWDGDGPILSHFSPGRFKTACGIDWWGKASASGYTEVHHIDCAECRRILLEGGAP